MSKPLRIAWLKTGPLHPLDTGGKLRTYHMLRELKKRHRVTYVSLCPENVDQNVKLQAAEYSDEQNWLPWKETPKRSVSFAFDLLRNAVFSQLPYTIEKYQSATMSQAVQSLERKQESDLVVCDFLTPSVNLITKEYVPRIPILLFQHNVESLIWQRLCERAEGWARRKYFHAQWQRMRRFEKEACAYFDGLVAVSEEDAAMFRKDFGLTNVLGAVPTGADTEQFQPPTKPRPPRSLVFLGSMDWMPNMDAMAFFIREMWPLLKQQFPECTLTVVGRNPPPQVQELARTVPGVKVTGTVPDVRPYLTEATVMIVPLRVGGGTRIKIFEGMATGIPVVSTRIGAEGLPVTHEKEILLADEPKDFCGQIGRLFQSAELAARIGDAGMKLVRERFGWGAVTQVFSGYCEAVAAKGKRA